MSFAASERTRVLNWVLNALTLGFLFLALVTLLLWFVPYPKMKVFLDSLAAVQNSNGRVTHPTEGGLHAFVARLPLASCLFVICAVALALLKCELRDFLLGIPPELPGIRKSLRDLFPPGIRTLQEIGAVLTVFGIGVFLRLWHVWRRSITTKQPRISHLLPCPYTGRSRTTAIRTIICSTPCWSTSAFAPSATQRLRSGCRLLPQGASPSQCLGWRVALFMAGSPAF